MKLPVDDLIIQREKLTNYLLVLQSKNDKSRFLAQAGFTLDNPDDLENAIRELVRDNEAIQDRIDEYGTFFRVTGQLRGKLHHLGVVTIWIYSSEERFYRFITLKPDREE
jgi:hypothetical protein